MFHPNQAFLLVQKLKSAPRGFRLGVKVEQEKILPICPKLLINADVNVLAFISNLGPNHKSKMLKVGPKFFGPLFLV